MAAGESRIKKVNSFTFLDLEPEWSERSEAMKANVPHNIKI